MRKPRIFVMDDQWWTEYHARKTVGSKQAILSEIARDFPRPVERHESRFEALARYEKERRNNASADR